MTGIAGPSGGTEEKPVGMVWIGYADDHGTRAVKHQFGRGRRRNKEKMRNRCDKFYASDIVTIVTGLLAVSTVRVVFLGQITRRRL